MFAASTRAFRVFLSADECVKVARGEFVPDSKRRFEPVEPVEYFALE
jgi:hypothetical protein